MTVNTAEDIKQVEAHVRSVWDCFSNQDPQGMLALLHTDCTVWDVFQPDLVTKREMEAYVTEDFSQSAARGKLTREMNNFVISVWDDTAVCRFTSSYSYAPPNPASGRGRTTCVLRRFPDLGWLVMHVHEGHRPDGIPPISEA